MFQHHQIKFLIAEESTMRQDERKLIEKLKIKIHGVNRNPMTPSTLTEKNW